MNNETTTAALPTTATVPAGHEIRIYAATASRDYTATAVGGTYPIEYTTSNYRPVPEGERPYYALVRLPIVSPERTESTVEYGGISLANRKVEAETHPHVVVMYAYEVRGKDMRGAFVLNY